MARTASHAISEVPEASGGLWQLPGPSPLKAELEMPHNLFLHWPLLILRPAFFLQTPPPPQISHTDNRVTVFVGLSLPP